MRFTRGIALATASTAVAGAGLLTTGATVNGGDGRIVETTPSGMQVASRFLDRSGSPPGSAALFGLALRPRMRGIYYVDDAANTLRLLH